MKGKGINTCLSVYDKENMIKLYQGGATHKDVYNIYKIHRSTIYRIIKRFDGTISSLENQSRRPKTKHPTAHTDDEVNLIKEILTEYDGQSLIYMWGIMKKRYGYKRHYLAMVRHISRHNLRARKPYEKYIPKPYYTPHVFGTKWQMDVKYVPSSCNSNKKSLDKFYQYSMLDESTRERFLYIYSEHTAMATVDFITKSIDYFRYKPVSIQTDNGSEFTNTRKTMHGKRKHIVDTILQKLHIKHKLIAPGTPRHNGKIERAHRKDQEYFYDHLQFKDFDDLQEKAAKWLDQYNDTPTAIFRDKNGKRIYISPREKRLDLEEELKLPNCPYNIRYIDS
jgi:transposase InsO family protein